MARDFSKRVSGRPLKVRGLILRKIEAVGRAKELRKRIPNWEGPYQIVQEVRSGTFRLKDLNGRPIKRTWNSDTLKKYHV